MDGRSSGLAASLARLAARGLDLLHTRLQLLALEIDEEARHFVTVLGLLLSAGACLAFAILLATVALVLACDEAHRLTVLAALAGLYALLGGGLALVTMTKLRDKTAPLADTLAQLQQDVRALGGCP
ncbi:MAG: phage holin family protein [Gammaproteobacteria bacterium]